MERVVFDLQGAADLADRMQRQAGRTEDLAARVEHLAKGAPGFAFDAVFDEHLLGVRAGLRAAETWANEAAGDLRWRLERLHAIRPDLPRVSVHTMPDGRVAATFGLRDRQDEAAWLQGRELHADLVASIDAIDGATADVLLDQLSAAVTDPIVIAGFASALGASGMGDLIDRLESAKQRDPRNTAAEWLGGSNPRWDTLKAEVASIAAGAGGLASYGAQDPVAVEFTAGGLQIVSMADLLLTDPLVLAGKWSADTDISRSPFAELGGFEVRLRPLGDNVLGPDRLLVTRVQGTPGQAFHWDDGVGLQAVTFAMPSNWQLAGQTVSAMAHDPVQALRTAKDNPKQAATGFLLGAGATLTAAYAWTALVAGGLVGGGSASTSAAATAATVASSRAALGRVAPYVSRSLTANSVMDTAQTVLTLDDCGGARDVAAIGQLIGSEAISFAFDQGRLPGANMAVDTMFGTWSIPVDCARHR